MATKSIGSASRDYATLSAWASYVNALSLSTPEVGEMYNDSEFTEAAAVTIGGWSGGSSTNTVTLTTAAGQSFRDNANAKTNALRYNQSNGVGVKMTGAFTASTISVTGSNFVLSNIQFTNTSSNGQHILLVNSGNANALLQNLIVQGRLWRNDQGLVQMFCKTNSVIQNVVVIVTSALGKGVSLLASGAGATSAYDLTIVSTNSSTGTGMNATYTPAPIVKNCTVYGFTTDYAGTCGTSANNATDKSSFGGTGWGTSGQTSITSAEWQSLTSGSEDLRLSTNSVKLKDNGAAAGPSIDIIGTTRPQRSAYDIGCWELKTFNPALIQNSSGDNLMYIRNTAGQNLGFGLLDVNTGAPLSGATVTVYRSIDGGTQASATGTASSLGNGQYNFALSQADTNGDEISFLFTASGAVAVEKTITTQELGECDTAGYPFFFPALFGSGKDGDATGANESDVGYLGSFGVKEYNNLTIPAGVTWTVGKGTSNGALMLAVKGTLRIEGTIDAKGENGAAGSNNTGGKGGAQAGGGGGGAAFTAAPGSLNNGNSGSAAGKFGHGAALATFDGTTAASGHTRGAGGGAATFNIVATGAGSLGGALLASAGDGSFSNKIWMAFRNRLLTSPSSVIRRPTAPLPNVTAADFSVPSAPTNQGSVPSNGIYGPWATTSNTQFLTFDYIPAGPSGMGGSATGAVGAASAGGGGGGGGGVVIIEAETVELVSGYAITANGGDGGVGGTQGTALGGGGGGGYGGVIVIICRNLIGSTSAVTANGGAAGAGGGGGAVSGLTGGAGGVYIMRV